MADAAAKITCPSCKKQFSAKPELIGKRVKCPKCAQPFTVTSPTISARATPTPAAPSPAPEANEYDIAPEPERAPAVPRVTYEPKPAPEPEPTDNTAAQAKAVLLVSARMAARGGVAGAATGLAIGGVTLLLMKIFRQPDARRAVKIGFRILLWGILGFLLLIFGLILLSRYMGPGHAAAPVGPRPPPAAMPDPRAGFGPAPTYDSLVQRFGADHVVKMTVLDVSNPQFDENRVRGQIMMRGSDAWAMTTQGNQIDCVFAIPMDFDTFIKMIHIGKIISTDAAQHSIVVSLAQP